ncbi:MAG: SDR family NAD(P)-dependent oxidoreductase [Streptococcaceae bacterium]|jgi:short-subunit dehydrogenase|nr:SDR family NAD(P)-dependent oxidoreductase [Streptococcaceae bacterium]
MKKALITGATGGLGTCLAKEAANRGMDLVLVGRSWEKLNALKDEIAAETPVSIAVYTVDFNHLPNTTQKMKHIFSKHPDVELLINNAGLGYFKELEGMTTTEVTEMISTNVFGLTETTKAFLESASPKAVLNISSMAAKMSSPKSSVYSATKAYVTQFSNTLRLELKPKKIGVHVVHAGPIATPFFEKADKTGEYVKKIDRWLIDPTKLAKQSLKMVKKNKRELNRPRMMKVGARFSVLFPRIADFFALKVFNYK